jgi:hypothetical protein
MPTARGDIDMNVIADMMNRYDAKMSTRLKSIFNSIVKPEVSQPYNFWSIGEVLTESNICSSYVSIKSLYHGQVTHKSHRLAVGFTFNNNVTDDTLIVIVNEAIERIPQLVREYIDKGESLLVR